MKVADILKITCQMTGNDDLAGKLESTLTDEEELRKNLLLEALNLVINEVACEYMPILKEEEFEVKNFKIDFSDFDACPLEIYAVKDRYGRRVRYKKYSSYLMVFSSKIKVTYSVAPDKVAFSDNITQINLPERVLAYACAREYFLHQNLEGEAQIWEEKFKASLENLLRRKSVLVLPKRRWI